MREEHSQRKSCIRRKHQLKNDFCSSSKLNQHLTHVIIKIIVHEATWNANPRNITDEQVPKKMRTKIPGHTKQTRIPLSPVEEKKKYSDRVHNLGSSSYEGPPKKSAQHLHQRDVSARDKSRLSFDPARVHRQMRSRAITHRAYMLRSFLDRKPVSTIGFFLFIYFFDNVLRRGMWYG